MRTFVMITLLQNTYRNPVLIRCSFDLGEFDILAEIPSYAGVSFQPENFPPLTINARTALFILKRRQLL
jgi:hypothetical protein